MSPESNFLVLQQDRPVSEASQASCWQAVLAAAAGNELAAQVLHDGWPELKGCDGLVMSWQAGGDV